ncbi:MAG: TetR/AcrR family transcriptional regulator [Lachnospiraceae bacterium]
MKKYEDEKSKIIRESIGEAIISLLKKEEFSEISVCSICNRAGVGRTTYYRYYGNKNGKEEAIFYWLINRWEEFIEGQTLSLEQTDAAVLSYIFSIRAELVLLNQNNLLHLFDSFILYIYGPGDKYKNDTGMFYVKYSGAGLWMGLFRALIDRNFSENEKEVKELMQQTLLLMTKAHNSDQC